MYFSDVILILKKEEDMNTIDTLTHSQRERLTFIDFRAYFLGEVRRMDIIERFNVATAASSRDLAYYKELGGKIELNQRTKTHLPEPDFQPIFKHSIETALTALSKGFGETDELAGKSLIQCTSIHQLNQPPIDILAKVSRAIYQKTPLRILYHSFRSGRRDREIVPFALIDGGDRWHVRAYDRLRKEFIDFVLTRIEAAELLIGHLVLENETAAHDIQWNRIVELELAPHPSSDSPHIVEMDYNMKNGLLKVPVRACMAGYFLRQFNIDCTENHVYNHPRIIRLWLKNRAALYGVDSVSIAPYYLDQ